MQEKHLFDYAAASLNPDLNISDLEKNLQAFVKICEGSKDRGGPWSSKIINPSDFLKKT